MRLGLLGPSEDPAKLRRLAALLLETHGVDRAVYLGRDDILDDVVAGWARDIVEGDPSDDAVWDRASELVNAQPDDIRGFIAKEKSRRDLAKLQVLPGVGARSVELLNGKVVVLIYDKAHLDEEDIIAASLLIFGKSPTSVVRAVGPRWFISPGVGGALLLEDNDDGIAMTLMDSEGKILDERPLDLARATKMRVQGASG